MAKKEKAKKNWDPARAEHFVGRVMNVQGDIDDIMSAAKDECSPYNEDIKQIKKEASDEGIPTKELNKLIASAKRLKKEVDAYDKCNDEEKEVIDIMRDQFGFIKMSEVREQLNFNI